MALVWNTLQGSVVKNKIPGQSPLAGEFFSGEFLADKHKGPVSGSGLRAMLLLAWHEGLTTWPAAWG